MRACTNNFNLRFEVSAKLLWRIDLPVYASVITTL
jgi:hypothetical protein